MTLQVTGGRNAATLPKALYEEPSRLLSRGRQNMSRFLKNLLESENLVCSAMPE